MSSNCSIWSCIIFYLVQQLYPLIKQCCALYHKIITIYAKKKKEVELPNKGSTYENHYASTLNAKSRRASKNAGCFFLTGANNTSVSTWSHSHSHKMSRCLRAKCCNTAEYIINQIYRDSLHYLEQYFERNIASNKSIKIKSNISHLAT